MCKVNFNCTWECSTECKPISEGEVDAILCLKAAFDLSVGDVRAALNTCDCGCPYGHQWRIQDFGVGGAAKGGTLRKAAHVGGCGGIPPTKI